MEATFFATPDELRAWLEANHGTAPELWVGFWKKGTGKPSITWPESVDQALCFGWIDGVRKSLDAERYVIRFTPRRPGSTWSGVNVRRMGELLDAGLVSPAGLRAFEARKPEKTEIYAYEQRSGAAFDGEQERRFRDNEAAWAFFQSCPTWYRRNATWWVVSARRPETREKRLATLIDDSARGRTIRHLTRPNVGSGDAA
jgi:uncharacterized protein YdeI (YjbR/CyaY-like superfamily)